MSVEAEVQNTEGLLKPGQFATVRITQSKPEPAVMIPVTGVKTVGDTNSVFVIKDGIAREQFVQLGLLENDLIQIKQGVIEGDLVAVRKPGCPYRRRIRTAITFRSLVTVSRNWNSEPGTWN